MSSQHATPLATPARKQETFATAVLAQIISPK